MQAVDPVAAGVAGVGPGAVVSLVRDGVQATPARAARARVLAAGRRRQRGEQRAGEQVRRCGPGSRPQAGTAGCRRRPRPLSASRPLGEEEVAGALCQLERLGRAGERVGVEPRERPGEARGDRVRGAGGVEEAAAHVEGIPPRRAGVAALFAARAGSRADARLGASALVGRQHACPSRFARSPRARARAPPRLGRGAIPSIGRGSEGSTSPFGLTAGCGERPRAMGATLALRPS